MDLDSENVEENEKYSFLLGSAIRNEDPDQFLSIYDAIIPKTLTDKQVKSTTFIRYAHVCFEIPRMFPRVFKFLLRFKKINLYGKVV